MTEEEYATTVKLSQRTRNRLKRVGMKGETYDELINRLLDDRADPQLNPHKEVRNIH